MSRATKDPGVKGGKGDPGVKGNQGQIGPKGEKVIKAKKAIPADKGTQCPER